MAGKKGKKSKAKKKAKASGPGLTRRQILEGIVYTAALAQITGVNVKDLVSMLPSVPKPPAAPTGLRILPVPVSVTVAVGTPTLIRGPATGPSVSV